MAECAKNCACAVGVWGKSDSVHRCYLKSKPATLGAIGAYKDNVAFNCTPTCKPPPAPAPHPGGGGSRSIKVSEWLKIGKRNE